MLEHFKDTEKMQEVLHQAQTGLWAIELDEGKSPRMYADASMLKLLGFDDEPTPEECYQSWHQRIEDTYYPIVQAGVERMIQDDRAEVQYPWFHPKWGRIYVRCGGVRDWSYQNGICLRGYHQNITNTVMLKQEYDSVIQSLSESYRSIFLCNLEDKTYKIIKVAEEFRSESELFSNYEDLFRLYVEKYVSVQFYELILELADSRNIRRKVSQGEKNLELLYRSKQNEWRRVKVIPSAQYSSAHPWVIAAFDEQNSEVERKIGDVTARIAVSQIYTLVISVDLIQSEYNCIHYSGKLLELEHTGSYKDFCSQFLSRMPLEDQKIYRDIFNPETYEKKRYQDGVLRLSGQDGALHYYNYYSARIREDLGERILLTIRNVDDKQEAQQRESILSNLCQCYYSIYLFDLENDTEEAIWQEEFIHRNQEFPKGSLDAYYSKFVREYVFAEDQEKMYRAGSPDFLRQVLSEENPVYEIDFRRIYPNHLMWVRSRFSVAEMRDGRVTKVIFANMNINEQKLEEKEQEEKNRKALVAAYETAKKANEAKSSFLAQMSHDIRTPMNAIIGMSAMASTRVEDPDKVRDCLNKINVSGRHLLTLINEILDMSRIEKGKVDLAEESFSLRGFMQEIESMTRSQAGQKCQEITFEFIDLAHDHLVGDSGRLSQVLLNLITNAIKYTPERGKITVTVQEVSQREYGYASYVFSVEDNGIGMSRDFLDYVFVPFSRSDDDKVQSVQGTGLGMSIAHGIVSAMGGNIQVESELGLGSRFSVTLNLKTEDFDQAAGLPTNELLPDSATQSANQENDAFPAGKHLLLAEDNELNMEIAKTLLEEIGFAVQGVENGQEAVDTFCQSEPGTYDAILMDLQMPVMDGCTAARRIRASSHAQAHSIPVIALTANAFAEDIAKTLAAGMNDHVSKPVDFGRLMEVLRRHIQQD